MFVDVSGSGVLLDLSKEYTF